MPDQVDPLRAIVRILSVQSPEAWGPEAYRPKAIFELLTKAFADSDLRRFCLHSGKFSPVCARLGRYYSVEQIADEIIDYAGTELLWNDLLKEIRQAKAARYKLHYPYERRIETLMKWMESSRHRQIQKRLEWPIEGDVLKRALRMSRDGQYDLFESRTDQDPSEGFCLIVGTGVLIAEGIIVTSVHSQARAQFCSTDDPCDPEAIRVDFPNAPAGKRQVLEAKILAVAPPARELEDQFGDGAIAFALMEDPKERSWAQPLSVDGSDGIFQGAASILGCSSENCFGVEVTGIVDSPSVQGSVRIRGNDGILTLPGFSGGPVLDQNRRLVGINVAGRSGSGERVAFMIPISHLRKAWPELEDWIASGPKSSMPPTRPKTSVAQSPTQSSTVQAMAVPRAQTYEVEMPDAIWREFLNVADATSILIPGSSDVLKVLQSKVAQVVIEGHSGSRPGDLQSLEQAFDDFDSYVMKNLTEKQRDTATMKKLEQLVAEMRMAMLPHLKMSTGLSGSVQNP
jgi:hypothetical protein